MARKMMSKEVTTTTVKLGKMVYQNGSAQAIMLPNETLLGNVSLANAQRQLNKKHGEPVTIFELQAETHIYELPVEQFIAIATVKE